MCTSKIGAYDINSNICRMYSYLAKHGFVLDKVPKALTVLQGLTCLSLYFLYI